MMNVFLKVFSINPFYSPDGSPDFRKKAISFYKEPPEIESSQNKQAFIINKLCHLS